MPPATTLRGGESHPYSEHPTFHLFTPTSCAAALEARGCPLHWGPGGTLGPRELGMSGALLAYVQPTQSHPPLGCTVHAPPPVSTLLQLTRLPAPPVCSQSASHSALTVPPPYPHCPHLWAQRSVQAPPAAAGGRRRAAAAHQECAAGGGAGAGAHGGAYTCTAHQQRPVHAVPQVRLLGRPRGTSHALATAPPLLLPSSSCERLCLVCCQHTAASDRMCVCVCVCDVCTGVHRRQVKARGGECNVQVDSTQTQGAVSSFQRTIVHPEHLRTAHAHVLPMRRR